MQSLDPFHDVNDNALYKGHVCPFACVQVSAPKPKSLFKTPYERHSLIPISYHIDP
jgi:hypothetical protein